jgi:hypothetical protein
MTKTDDTDYSDFCGSYVPDFSKIDEKTVEGMLVVLKTSTYLDALLIFGNETPHLALYAFSKGYISREQMATLLEVREMHQIFSTIQARSFFDDEGNWTDVFQHILPHFCSKDQAKYFFEYIRKLPAAEQYYYTITHISAPKDNPKLNDFLSLVESIKLIHISNGLLMQRFEFPEAEQPKQVTIKRQDITIFGIGVRNALMQARYGAHAKKLFPRLGIFTKDDIESSIRKNGRYSAVAFPEVPDVTQFHQITARTFYLTLHDEYHRYLMSTIPNSLHLPYLYAINVIRERAQVNGKNVRWSKEIWEAMDMEFGAFIPYTTIERDANDIATISSNFYRLITDQIYSENRTPGLFYESPDNDTTWVLLIDFVEHRKEWLKFNIDPLLFPESSTYRKLYDFVIQQRALLKPNQSVAQNVAILKSKYFNLPYDLNDKTEFVKKDDYLQVMDNNKPVYQSKCKVLILNKLRHVWDLIDYLKLLSGDDRRSFLNYLADSSLYRHIIPSCQTVQYLINENPEYTSEILRPIVSNPKEYQRIIVSLYSLEYLIRSLGPDFTDDLLKPILTDQKELRRLITNGSELRFLISFVPEYKKKLEACFYQTNLLLTTRTSGIFAQSDIQSGNIREDQAKIDSDSDEKDPNKRSEI